MSVKILAIESSCDETAAAVIIDGKTIASNCIYTQIAIHRDYGGVVPEIASRQHLEQISVVVQNALKESNTDASELSAIAVTEGPGLVGSLLVGLSYAKAMAFALDLPLIGVHHLIGHLYGGIMSAEDLTYPFVGLIASGGHSTLVKAESPLDFEVLGETRDDAAGEVIDKVARSIGLPYPGGAALEKLAADGDKTAIDFPRAWLEQGSYDFSFSGLKSSALNFLNQSKMKNLDFSLPDFAASFQEAVLEVLAVKAVNAGVQYGVRDLVLSGGVAANGRLRELLLSHCKEQNINFHYPPKILCTDNGAMIGGAAYELYKAKRFTNLNINAVAVLPLSEFCGKTK